MNLILLSSLTVVSAGIGFAKFEQTNPDLRRENVEHSIKHNHARLSLLATEEFVATELRSFINNVARGVGFAVDRNIYLPYGMHYKSFNPSYEDAYSLPVKHGGQIRSARLRRKLFRRYHGL